MSCPVSALGDALAAIVLAAGRSSRMGAFKPLLPFGERTAIGEVVAGMRAAGVGRIHVVVGFNAEALAPELARLGVTVALNPDFDRGMASSLRVGVSSLPEAVKAFLIAPADMPLVRASTIARLIEAAASDPAAILYPAFRGERGHPTLIRRPLFAEILAFDGAGGLAPLLARHEADARNVAVFDWGCLADMDTPDDYRRLLAAAPRHRVPDASECEAMLDAAATPDPVRRHCRAAAALASDIGRRLRLAGEPLDPDRIRAAAWLHDIAKGRPDHAAAGAAMIGAFGFPELVEAVARHTELGGDRRLDEAAVVFLADKLVQGETRVSLETRFVPALTRFVDNPGAFAAASRRYAEARRVLEAIEARIGRIETPAEAARPRPTACCGRPASLGRTESVCPECLAVIPAERVAVGDTVHLRKTCPEHGSFSTPVWRGLVSYRLWGAAPRAYSRPPVAARPVERGCPLDCGLCPDHRQQSCCVLLEVTSRCDLACPVCYASANRCGADASLAEIDGWLDALMESGGRVHIQLSGGEPTVRDDLPEIVARARARGFDFVQLNSNGVRLAKDPDFVAALAKAGLDCVFLQFDGVDDHVYKRLRGARLMRLKAAAIDNCAKAGLGVVLTPTLVPGVNVPSIGDIVEFAVARVPAVRAVHFQPVSHFGRCLAAPDPSLRVTLPDVMEALIAHSGGSIRLTDFRPGSAENPYCSFSGRFVVDAAGRLAPIAEEAQPCCGAPAEAPESSCCGSTRPSPDVARERRYVAGQWSRPARDDPPAAGLEAFDAFLTGRERTLGLSGMAFQDAWTLDLDRLRQCHIHVVAPDRRVIPFCAYNLTSRDGRPLYRAPAEARPREAVG